MLKGSELRRGNQVWESSLFNPAPADFEEIVIASVNDIDKVVHDEQDNIYSYDYIYPIPLTPEWIERLGFEPAENSPGDGWYEIQIGRHTLQICINGQCNMMNIVDEHDQSVLFRKVLIVQDVHQLQNLYHSLTGKELTIKS